MWMEGGDTPAFTPQGTRGSQRAGERRTQGLNAPCFLSCPRAVPTAHLPPPCSEQPQPPSEKTCHESLCQLPASAPRRRSPQGGGVKHRAFKRQARMRCPALTLGFNQVLKTLLREKRKKNTTPKLTPPPPPLSLFSNPLHTQTPGPCTMPMTPLLGRGCAQPRTSA